jgi:hypothetical protein
VRDYSESPIFRQRALTEGKPAAILVNRIAWIMLGRLTSPDENEGNGG